MVASGIYGLYVTRTVPRKLRGIDDEVPYDRIPGVQRELAVQARELVQRCEDETHPDMRLRSGCSCISGWDSHLCSCSVCISNGGSLADGWKAFWLASICWWWPVGSMTCTSRESHPDMQLHPERSRPVRGHRGATRESAPRLVHLGIPDDRGSVFPGRIPSEETFDHVVRVGDGCVLDAVAYLGGIRTHHSRCRSRVCIVWIRFV